MQPIKLIKRIEFLLTDFRNYATVLIPRDDFRTSGHRKTFAQPEMRMHQPIVVSGTTNRDYIDFILRYDTDTNDSGADGGAVVLDARSGSQFTA